jgi:tRNA(Ser,Leu) C12 N-acetylase TAN1
MRDWNVVVTTQERHFTEAKRLLRAYGEVATSDFFNVLLVKVDDPDALLQALARRAEEDPLAVACLGRVTPLRSTFLVQSKDEFERRSTRAVEEMIPELEGKSFHVRMHRRGFKGRISSLEEEQRLDELILEQLSAMGRPGRISFDDPDAVIDVELVGTQAGVSLLTRGRLDENPLLHPD